mgnify:FL=1
MLRYKLSPEERAAEKERKDNLRNIMKGLDVKKFDDLKDVFKIPTSYGEIVLNLKEGKEPEISVPNGIELLNNNICQKI